MAGLDVPAGQIMPGVKLFGSALQVRKHLPSRILESSRRRYLQRQLEGSGGGNWVSLSPFRRTSSYPLPMMQSISTRWRKAGTVEDRGTGSLQTLRNVKGSHG